MSTERGTFENSAIQVRHDGRELRVIVAGEDVARIEGPALTLHRMLLQAAERVQAIAGEQDAAEDDGEPAVCVYCGMLLDWEGPLAGWIGKRYVRDGGEDEPDIINEEVPICPVPHEDGNLHRPITPAERAEREPTHPGDHDDIYRAVLAARAAGPCPACGDPEGPCEIAPCGDPGCDARDCESHETCVRKVPRCLHCHGEVMPDALSGYVALLDGAWVGNCPENPDSINHEVNEEQEPAPVYVTPQRLGALLGDDIWCPYGCGYRAIDPADLVEHRVGCVRA